MSRAISSVPTNQFNNDGDHIKSNRTAAVIVRYGAYFTDDAQAATGSTDLDHGLSQILAVTTALIAKKPRVVIANSDPAATYVAGDPVRCFEGEGIRCQVKVDGSGTNIAAGDRLKPQNASPNMLKATLGTDTWYVVAGKASTAAGDIIPGLLYSSGRF